MNIMNPVIESRGWRTELAAVLYVVAILAAGFAEEAGRELLVGRLDMLAEVLKGAAVAFLARRVAEK